MLSNKEVSKIFKLMADLMELHNENAFKAKSYANSAFQIGRVEGSVMQMNLQQLENTPGIGKSVASKIIELQQTGTMQVLENLMQLTPAGVLEIMHIKGLGAKKVAVIWKELNIESVGELLYACYENRLSKLKGFGEKTQQSVIASIEYYQSNLGKFHFATVAVEANAMVEMLKEKLQIDKVSLCGDVRRMTNILDNIEIIIPAGKEVVNKLEPVNFFEIEKIEDDFIIGKSYGRMPCKIYFSNAENFYYDLFVLTGSSDHVNKITTQIKNQQFQFQSEEDIYKMAGVNYILPELREGGINLETIKNNALVSDADIKGVVHNHSTWSDGKNTIEQMAQACINSGYEYFVISDHSKTAVYAGGLKAEDVLRQHSEIDDLNNKLRPFKIFKSIESDILNDGSLDYDESILKQFDLVIASVHSNLKMDEEKATKRLLKTIENPYTTILGHMTGRLLLSRPGYPIDHKKIIEACAANLVIIEINANPYRLDIDHTWIPFAMEKGVMISINPDAHSIEGINDIHWGIISARKGALTKTMTWNAMSLSEIEIWLRERKIKKGI
ncbi:MAG: DNA polymerase/3'-5' exonuclease PolX [Fimbriimonadaceae bacterium]|nr:DNA polymerase/3'-5' exonuclease PolX [Chitinophagales bacterium]